MPLYGLNANRPNQLRGGGVNVGKPTARTFMPHYHRFMRRYCILALTLTSAVFAQTTRTIQATGSATLTVTPDQAGVDAGVVTSAATAQDAAQQNATQTTAVISAVKAVLGTTGTV